MPARRTSSPSRGLAEGLVAEEDLEAGGRHPVVVEAVEGYRLGLLRVEVAGEVARSKTEVVRVVRAERSSLVLEEVVARSSLAKAAAEEPRKLAHWVPVERWMLVTGEALRFWRVGLEAVDLEAVEMMGEVKEARPM